jgi:archaemetzincin
MSQIDLVFHLFKNPDLNDYLKDNIFEILRIPTRVLDKKIEIESFFDQDRFQYNAAQIIQSLGKNLTTKTLIYTTVDIFIPIFTFVFGLAQFEGNAGIISIHRLDNIYYGLPEDKNILHERTLKESIHEFGHLIGLHHCPQFGCVMSNSPSTGEIDLKKSNFCSSCRKVFVKKISD